jgi:hypothetical protein
MPFINGSYYMNPAYGRAVERARADEVPPANQKEQRGPEGQNRTMGYHPASSHKFSSPQNINQQAQTVKTNKIYNEFSGLRPKKGMTTSADLDRARISAAHVYHNVNGRGFQGSSTLGRDDARDVKIQGTSAAEGYKATMNAVAAAAKEQDTTQNANHVYIYDPEAIHSRRGIRPPDWVTQGQTTTIAGPFINQSGGGDVPRGHDVYIITVNDRNMRHPDE